MTIVNALIAEKLIELQNELDEMVDLNNRRQPRLLEGAGFYQARHQIAQILFEMQQIIYPNDYPTEGDE